MRKKLTPQEFASRLKLVQPDLKIIGLYESMRTKILVKNKYGTCLVYPHLLLQGHKPSIATATNRNEYFIAQSKEIHGDKYDYSMLEYTGYLDLIKIKRQNGSFYYTTPYEHLRVNL